MKFLPFFSSLICYFTLSKCLSDPSFLIAPSIVPSLPQIIGNQVPKGFAPKIALNPRLYRNTRNECPCAMSIAPSCPPCTSTPSTDIIQQIMSLNNCDCAPRLQCDPCPKLYQAIHEMALRQASFDLNTQNSLQMKAQEQARLYGEAQKFAMEMQQQEEKALEAAKLMNEAANKAEISRQHMLKANAKARELAESSLYAYSNSNNGFLSVSPPFNNYGGSQAQQQQSQSQWSASNQESDEGKENQEEPYNFKEAEIQTANQENTQENNIQENS